MRGTAADGALEGPVVPEVEDVVAAELEVVVWVEEWAAVAEVGSRSRSRPSEEK